GLAARQAQRTADSGLPGLQEARGLKARATQSMDEIRGERDTLQTMADALDPDAIEEHAVELYEDSLVLGAKREALLANIADAEDAVFGLEHAVVEQSHALQLETY